VFGYFSSRDAPIYFPGAAFVVAALFALIGPALLVSHGRRSASPAAASSADRG
jgi:hypothetical protein